MKRSIVPRTMERVTQLARRASHTRPGLWWGAWPGLAGMVLLGSSVAVIAATQHLPVFGVQAARYAVAAVTLVVLARAFGIRLVLPRRGDIAWVVGGALSGLVGFNLATVVGTRHAEPGLLGAAVACIPIALAIAGPLTQRRRPSPHVVTGAIVVSVGAVAVTGWGRGDGIGIVMAASLIVFEAGFTLMGSRALPRMGPWSYSAATAVVAAIFFAALSALVERPAPWRRSPSRRPWRRSCTSVPSPPRSRSCSGSPASSVSVRAPSGSAPASPHRRPRSSARSSGPRCRRWEHGWEWRSSPQASSSASFRLDVADPPRAPKLLNPQEGTHEPTVQAFGARVADIPRPDRRSDRRRRHRR